MGGIVMNKFELFSMIYYALHHYWQTHNDKELASFLSDMNPFLFDDIGSAVPSVYETYSLLVDKEISINDSFDIAHKYAKSIGLPAVIDAIDSIQEEDWKKRCAKYLASTHKGQNTN
jgi:hypothetical protein